VRRSISNTFDSSGAQSIWAWLILTFCDRVTIGLLPSFDVWCANINRLWFLRENAPTYGDHTRHQHNKFCSVPLERQRRIASRRGRSLQRSPRYLSRASHRRLRPALIAALPTLRGCLLTRHGRRPSALQVRLTGSVLVGPEFLHSRISRISDRRDCLRGEAPACGNSVREMATSNAKRVRQMIIGRSQAF
jgi:hypothetical protein